MIITCIRENYSEVPVLLSKQQIRANLTYFRGNGIVVQLDKKIKGECYYSVSTSFLNLIKYFDTDDWKKKSENYKKKLEKQKKANNTITIQLANSITISLKNTKRNQYKKVFFEDLIPHLFENPECLIFKGNGNKILFNCTDYDSKLYDFVISDGEKIYMIYCIPTINNTFQKICDGVKLYNKNEHLVIFFKNWKIYYKYLPNLPKEVIGICADSPYYFYIDGNMYGFKNQTHLLKSVLE